MWEPPEIVCYILDLLKSIVTVSVETAATVTSLPPLEVIG